MTTGDEIAEVVNSFVDEDGLHIVVRPINGETVESLAEYDRQIGAFFDRID